MLVTLFHLALKRKQLIILLMGFFWMVKYFFITNDIFLSNGLTLHVMGREKMLRVLIDYPERHKMYLIRFPLMKIQLLVG